MMQFFRKHQRIFFIVMTVIIIISFSFFGTYSSLVANEYHDEEAFKTPGGEKVMKSKIAAMTRFISSDSFDKLLFGGIWGPNFLNDGVVRKDFLESGVALVVAAPFFNELQTDLNPRLEKEKRYQSYSHPQMPFIGAEVVWGQFAPEINRNLEIIKHSDGQLNSQTFEAQANLFVEERRFPAPYLQEVLRHQQKQFGWVTPDPALGQQDLSLFGYHTLEDWFGPKFLQLVSEVIINSAAIAESKGYTVSRDEALSDLLLQSEKSFREQQQIRNSNLGVKNSQEYFQMQLRYLSLDQAAAVDLWRDVLLFRRLMDGVGNAVFVDPLVYKNYLSYAGEKAKVDLYQLPPSLRFNNAGTLEQFQVYIDSVGADSFQKISSTELPSKYKSIEEIKSRTPELVQKRYLLEIAEVPLKAVGLKVPLREAWDWELEQSNWKALVARFPELGVKSATTRQDRFTALEQLDQNTRLKVDEFARASIVHEHPEWIQDALERAPMQKQVVGIIFGQPVLPIRGVQNVAEFQKLLDQAAQPDEMPSSHTAADARESLLYWTGDQQTYYKINVLNRSNQWEVLTFAESMANKQLESILNKHLESYYTEIRETDRDAFKREDGSWKPFSAVKAEVSNRYFDPLYKRIQQDAKKQGDQWDPKMQQSLKDFCAAHRFASYMNKTLKEFEKTPSAIPLYVKENVVQQENLDLKPVESLSDQWKLTQVSLEISRDSKELLESGVAFSMTPGQWSKLYAPVDGNIYFFQMINKIQPEESIGKLMEKGQALLGNEARRVLMTQLVQQMVDKKSFSLTSVTDPSYTETMEAPAK